MLNVSFLCDVVWFVCFELACCVRVSVLVSCVFCVNLFCEVVGFVVVCFVLVWVSVFACLF